MSVPTRSAVRPLTPHIVPKPRLGALRPAEVANAGVFGALAVIIVSVGTFLPHLGVIELLSTVPFAIVGLRYRVRAVIATRTLTAADLPPSPVRRGLAPRQPHGLRLNSRC